MTRFAAQGLTAVTTRMPFVCPVEISNEFGLWHGGRATPPPALDSNGGIHCERGGRTMLKTTFSACVFAMLAMSSVASAQAGAPTHRPDDEGGQPAVMSPALIGTWKSAPQEMRLTSVFDETVWGPNAKSVRTVNLRILPSAEGLLTITKKVVDARGRTVKASTSVEEVTLRIGGSRRTVATRIEHDVDVLGAVRQYRDDPGHKWELSGLRVKLVTFADDGGNTLEVRVDTPEGRGSFWETLRLDVRTPGPRTAQRPHAGGAKPL
jgi:hypothetical protein